MSIKRWKLGWKRCDCVKCEAALTIEQTEEDCGWVRWGDHKEENARLKAEVERLTKAHSDALADFWAIHNGYFELKAEVERLTIQRAKLIESAEELFRFVGQELYGPIDHFEAAWEAAKEGKQP